MTTTIKVNVTATDPQKTAITPLTPRSQRPPDKFKAASLMPYLLCSFAGSTKIIVKQ